ncbi:hypothetical protein Glove_15g30 [Diversispora epigaea]|uniref:Uncharacterized protein n=1 Tax=Diversispora epigaea TaxID=1348612 RepID=A0A397JM15_9GLOM|nr:hypothetical protein Glove_15g30 [Diversispora epigaea]
MTDFVFRYLKGDDDEGEGDEEESDDDEGKEEEEELDDNEDEEDEENDDDIVIIIIDHFWVNKSWFKIKVSRKEQSVLKFEENKDRSMTFSDYNILIDALFSEKEKEDGSIENLNNDKDQAPLEKSNNNSALKKKGLKNIVLSQNNGNEFNDTFNDNENDGNFLNNNDKDIKSLNLKKNNVENETDKQNQTELQYETKNQHIDLLPNKMLGEIKIPDAEEIEKENRDHMIV